MRGYLTKARTLAMNIFRVSAEFAISEYLPDPSFQPPIAIVTFNLGCFFLKFNTFLYWAV